MTYPLTGSLYEYATLLQNLLIDNKEDLGLEEVFYGDQEKINTTPIACVEPDQKNQDYKSTGMYSQSLSCFIIIYASKVQSSQQNRKDSDSFAEAIELLIHSNRTLGGKVIATLVRLIESGNATKQNTLYRASRLTVVATSQTLMP